MKIVISDGVKTSF
jgi:hypothetical protein